MAERIVFTAKQRVELEEFATPSVEADQILIRSLYSLISTGTEGIVFNQLYDQGTHWANWVKYPFYPGYSMVGEVLEIGPDVRKLKMGDRVVARVTHASRHVIAESQCVRVPEGVQNSDAVWHALVKIAAMGARAGHYGLGDSILVIGAGPIGQITVRWARAAGAESIIVADRAPRRLQYALNGGATCVIGQPIEEAREEILRVNHGEAPNTVVDTTGNAQVFISALAVARKFGRVVIMGDTGTPAQQHLSSDVMSKGLTIVAAHDSHETAEWNMRLILRLYFSLLQTGRFNMNGLNTHEFQPNECRQAYETLNQKRDETMGILFNWTQS